MDIQIKDKVWRTIRNLSIVEAKKVKSALARLESAAASGSVFDIQRIRKLRHTNRYVIPVNHKLRIIISIENDCVIVDDVLSHSTLKKVGWHRP